MKKLVLAALLAAIAPSAAMAVTFSYDAAADYGNPVFSYGYGTAGVSFTAFPNSYAGGCFGSTNFACMTPGNNSIQPIIGLNTGAVTTLGTLALPNDRLVTHPYSTVATPPAVANSDAILIFTAPTSAYYTFSGFFDRLDETPNGGNGVIVSRMLNGAVTDVALLANGPQYAQITFGGSGFYAAGTQFGFAVGNNGDYNYDSTGLSLQISGSVPEPASWAMMVGGFGLLGAGMRASRRRNLPGVTA